MHVAWQLDRPKRVRALARFTALTPSHPSSACELPTTITAPLPSPGACSSDVPRPSSGPALAQLPTMLKGQGPPATQSICQAADQSLGSEKRETQTPDTLAFSSLLKAQQRNAR